MTYIKRKLVVVRRLWPLLVSLGSASIMLLAFFIPSVQDQWDRYQARKIVQQYVHLGDEFFEERKYDMAEQAYEKAFDLSNQSRLDIDMLRLRAKVNRMNMVEEWGAEPPEGLSEIDFEMLLHQNEVRNDKKQEVEVMNSYAQFLADTGKLEKAEVILHEALRIDSTNALTWVNLGNVADDNGKEDEAEKDYKRAISLDAENAEAHYNLGLLYRQQEKDSLAKTELAIADKLGIR